MIKTQQKSPPSFIQSVWAFLVSPGFLAIVLIVLVVVAVRLPIDYRRIMQPTDNDYTTHIYYALDMLHGRAVPAFTLAHSLWQLGLMFVWWASRSRIDFWQSAIAFQVLSSVAAALIVYVWFGRMRSRPSPWMRAFWAVSLVIVTPVIAPKLLDGAYYFGYIGLANYHNPTVHVLRPFALLMFMFAMQVLGERETGADDASDPVEAAGTPADRGRLDKPWLRKSMMVLAAAVIFAGGTFLKPSYTVTLVPALGLMGLYWLWKSRPLDWTLAVVGIGLPSVLLLAPQFVITYIQGEIDGGIAVMPFVAANMLSDYVLLKFVMSIFFPLVVLVLFWKRAIRDREIVLAWLAFAVGSLQYFLLVELGSRFTHANFLWGAQITLFMLFVITIRFLIRQTDGVRGAVRPAVLASYAAYLPHIISGIAYYIFCFTTQHYG